ncbi:MAG: hypothetical protein K4571_14800 [Deltaproteobacteria bacterium]
MHLGIAGKVFMSFIILVTVPGLLTGCESGDKVIDEATGNRALQQYQATREKLNTIDEKQKREIQNLSGKRV